MRLDECKNKWISNTIVWSDRDTYFSSTARWLWIKKILIDVYFIYCKRCGNPFLSCQRHLFVKLKMCLALCYFHFPVRFDLARLNDVSIGTETVCMIFTFAEGHCGIVYILESWYLCSYACFSSHTGLQTLYWKFKEERCRKEWKPFLIINWVFLHAFRLLKTFKSP